MSYEDWSGNGMADCFAKWAAMAGAPQKNWSLRERAFSLEQVRRERLERSTGFDAEWVLDEEDVRTIAGTMGRFPAFRETGWRILADARIVEAQ